MGTCFSCRNKDEKDGISYKEILPVDDVLEVPATAIDEKEVPVAQRRESNIWNAAYSGNIVAIDQSLTLSGNEGVNWGNKHGMTALYVAAEKGHLAVVDVLLKHEAKFDEPTNRGSTPLYIAAQNGNLPVVKKLVEYDKKEVTINFPRIGGMTPLYVAAFGGHRAIVDYLLDNNAKIDLPTGEGATPLYAATQEGKLSVVTLLISRGANPEASMNDGSTPLYVACRMGHLPCVQFLLKRGANWRVNLVPKSFSSTPMCIASENGHLKVCQELVKHVEQLDEEENKEDKLKNSKTNKHLLLNTPQDKGWTPLHLAMFSGHRDIVQYLLEQGAEETPLDDGVYPEETQNDKVPENNISQKEYLIMKKNALTIRKARVIREDEEDEQVVN